MIVGQCHRHHRTILSGYTVVWIMISLRSWVSILARVSDSVNDLSSSRLQILRWYSTWRWQSLPMSAPQYMLFSHKDKLTMVDRSSLERPMTRASCYLSRAMHCRCFPGLCGSRVDNSRRRRKSTMKSLLPTRLTCIDHRHWICFVLHNACTDIL